MTEPEVIQLVHRKAKLKLNQFSEHLSITPIYCKALYYRKHRKDVVCVLAELMYN
jgi:hypothetical protein